MMFLILMFLSTTVFAIYLCPCRDYNMIILLRNILSGLSNLSSLNLHCPLNQYIYICRITILGFYVLNRCGMEIGITKYTHILFKHTLVAIIVKYLGYRLLYLNVLYRLFLQYPSMNIKFKPGHNPLTYLKSFKNTYVPYLYKIISYVAGRR